MLSGLGCLDGGCWNETCAVAPAGVVCAAALLHTPVEAQQNPPTDPAELDPNAPLDPMPDLGVEWPDMNAPTRLPNSFLAIRQNPSRWAIPSTMALLRDVIRSGLRVLVKQIAKSFVVRSTSNPCSRRTRRIAPTPRRLTGGRDRIPNCSPNYFSRKAITTPKFRRISSVKPTASCALADTPRESLSFRDGRVSRLAEAGGDAEALRNAFAVKTGDPVVAQEVISAGVALRVALGEQGFATAEIGAQEYCDRSRKGVGETRSSGQARAGRPVRGDPGQWATTVQRAPCRQIARFKTGDRFEQSEVDDLRRALVATGLVASVETKVVPREGREVVDIVVRLEPAPMRTVAGELGYGTGEGVRAEASWQHRNFFNPEGALTVRGVAGTQEQLAAVSFRRNNFQRRDQVLNAQISASHLKRDAFDAKTFSLSGGIERQSNFIWQKKWTWSLGGELVASDERDKIEATGADRRRTFFVAALPEAWHMMGQTICLIPPEDFDSAVV